MDQVLRGGGMRSTECSSFNVEMVKPRYLDHEYGLYFEDKGHPVFLVILVNQYRYQPVC